MSTAHVVVTLVAAALSAFSAGSVFFRAKWVTEPLTEYSVPTSWWPWLGTAKAAGAAGLVVGLFAPVVGIAAGIGLIAYYSGAVITVARARVYSHIPFPLVYMAPVVASLVLA